MSATLSQNFLDLQTEVQKVTTVEQSALTLIQGLASELAAAIAANANGDTAALPNLQASLDTATTALAAAVAANTAPPAAAAAAPLPASRIPNIVAPTGAPPPA